jgi:hypothetical protein
LKLLFLDDAKDNNVVHELYDRVEKEWKTTHRARRLLYDTFLSMLGKPGPQALSDWFGTLKHECEHKLDPDDKNELRDMLDYLKDIMSEPKNIKVTTAFDGLCGFKISEFIAPGMKRTALLVIFTIFLYLMMKKFGDEKVLIAFGAVSAVLILCFVDCAPVVTMCRSLMFRQHTTPQADIETPVALLFEGICLGIFGSHIDVRNMKAFGESMCLLDRHSRSMAAYFDRIKDWFIKAVSYVAGLFGIEMTRAYSEFDDELKDLSNILTKIMTGYQKANGSIDHRMAILVGEFDSKVLDLMNKIPPKAENNVIRNIIEGKIRMLAPVKAALADSGVFAGERIRTIPMVILGNSGVGKTYNGTDVLKACFIDSLPSYELDDAHLAADKCIYTRLPGCKFQDGYNCHWAIQLTDAFSLKDSPGGEESESTFLIQCIGDGVMPFNQSNVVRKGKIFNKSFVVQILTNIGFISPTFFKSLNNPTAIVNRLTENAWFQYVNPEYAVPTPKPGADGLFPVGFENDATFWNKVNVDKAKANIDPEYGINVDVPRYRRWDYRTGTFALPIDDRSHLDFIKYQSSHINTSIVDAMEKKSADTKFLKAYAKKRLPNAKEEESIKEMFADLPGIAQGDDSESVETDSAFSTALFEPDAPLDVRDFEDKHLIWEDDIGDLKELGSYTRYKHVSRKFHAYKSTLPDTNCLVQEVVNRHAGLAEYIGSYLRRCQVSKKRVPLSEYKFYRDDPLHPVHALIDGLNLSELARVAKESPSENFMMLMMYHLSETCSWVMAWMRSTIQDLKDTAIAFYKGKYDPTLWFVEHPIISSILTFSASFAAGFLVTLVVKNIFTMGMRLFGGSMTPQYFEDQEIPYIEDMSQALDPVLGSSQAGRETSEDDKFIEARSDSHWHIVLRIQYVNGAVDEKPVIYLRKPAVFTFVGSTVGITVWHVQKMIEDLEASGAVHSIDVGLANFGVLGKVPKIWIRRKDIRMDGKFAKDDLTIWTVSKLAINAQPNFYKYLPSRADKEFCNYLRTTASMDVMFVRKTGDMKKESAVKMKFGGSNFYKYSTTWMDPVTMKVHTCPSQEVSIEESFEIRKVTEYGECGQFGYLIDRNRLAFASGNSVYQNPVPVYMHNSLNPSANGCGIVIYKEYFDDYKHLLLNVSNPREAIPRNFDEVVEEFIEEIKAEKLEKGVGQSSLAEIQTNFASHHRVVAQLPKLNQNIQSTIKRSEMHGVFPITRVPAKLKFVTIEDEVKPIMPKSRHHYGSNDSVANLEAMDAVADGVTRFIVNKSSPIEHRITLSYEQVVKGDTGFNLPPLDRSTSCGPTLNLVKAKLGFKGKGKTWIFGDGDLPDLDKLAGRVLRRLVKKAKMKLLGGDRLYALYQDCLKDELRAIEKVKEGSTRLFCACDLVYLILCKMYFGSFASWIVENRIRNGICIGINPYGYEWTVLYKTLRRKGDNGIFGDFSKYDKRLLACLIFATLYLIRRFYGPNDPEANAIREMLFEEMVNSFHAVPDGDATAIYEWLHGNTSGNFLTAIINSIGNIVLCIYVFCAILIAKKGGDIMTTPVSELPIEYCLEQSEIQTYGDDNAISVSDELAQSVDFYTMQTEVARVGLGYTDELKGANGLVPKHRPIKDGNFIARNFEESSFYGPVRMMAGLRLPSILEAPQWYRKTVDSANIVLIVERCNVELTIRGEADHAKYVPPMAERCYKEYGVWPRYTNWALTMAMLERIPTPLYIRDSPQELGEELMKFLAAGSEP